MSTTPATTNSETVPADMYLKLLQGSLQTRKELFAAQAEAKTASEAIRGIIASNQLLTGANAKYFTENQALKLQVKGAIVRITEKEDLAKKLEAQLISVRGEADGKLQSALLAEAAKTDAVRAEILPLKAGFEELQRKFRDLQDLPARLEDLGKAKQAAEAALENARRENKKLKETHSSYKVATDAQLLDLRRKLSASKDESGTIDSLRAELAKSAAELKASLAQTESSRADLANEKRAKAAMEKSLREGLDALRAKLAATEGALTTAQGQYLFETSAHAKTRRQLTYYQRNTLLVPALAVANFQQ